MFLSLKHSALGGAPLLATACFAAGLTVGALSSPGSGLRNAEPATASAPAPVVALRSGHPAEVVRIFDGDTFEARVKIWPGMEITTRVRLRGIDAPEMSARCPEERVKAEAARDALLRLLNEGSVAISHIGQDKYGGRVDADVSTARTPDVSAVLAGRGLVRRYTGGKRESWCG